MWWNDNNEIVQMSLQSRLLSWLITLETAWRGRLPPSVLSVGPLTPTPIREYNGLRGVDRGPTGLSIKSANDVQDFIMISQIYYEQERYKVSLKFEFDWDIVSGTGAWRGGYWLIVLWEI